MTNIPCKECICFPVCSNKYRSEVLGFTYVSHMSNNCCILKEYIDSKKNDFDLSYIIYKIRQLFDNAHI